LYHGAPGRFRSGRGFGGGAALGSIPPTDVALGDIASIYLQYINTIPALSAALMLLTGHQQGHHGL